MAIIFSLACAGLTGLTYLDCQGFGRGTGYEVRWTWGCYVKLGDGSWVPKDYVFGTAHELRLKNK